jgi:hypothetical protein
MVLDGSNLFCYKKSLCGYGIFIEIQGVTVTLLSRNQRYLEMVCVSFAYSTQQTEQNSTHVAAVANN